MPLTEKASPEWLSYAARPEEVLDFCGRKNILREAELAVELAKESFPEAHRLAISVEEDEAAEQYLVIQATVSDTVAGVIEKRGRCIEKWMGAIPWPASGLIILTHSLA